MKSFLKNLSFWVDFKLKVLPLFSKHKLTEHKRCEKLDSNHYGRIIMTTYVVCMCLLQKYYLMQKKVLFQLKFSTISKFQFCNSASERQICEKQILFTLPVFAGNLVRGSCRWIIFSYFFLLKMSDQTHYLLDCGI